MPINKSSGTMLPGMDEYMKDAGQGDIWFVEEKVADFRFFDSSRLPDSPKRQVNGIDETFTIMLLFPSKEEMFNALNALTNGMRKNMADGKRIGSINAVAEMTDGRTFLEYWLEELLGIKRKKKKHTDEDEARNPD